MTFLRRQGTFRVLDNIILPNYINLIIKTRLMRQRRAETFRISSRGKGTYFIRGGGGRTLSRHRKNKKITIISLNNSDYYFCDTPLSNISTWCLNIVSKRYESAACMIIEDNPPLPTKQRHNPYQDTTQRFLNHLVLPKHRTSKFSSNRHRKLQPFRET